MRGTQQGAVGGVEVFESRPQRRAGPGPWQQRIGKERVALEVAEDLGVSLEAARERVGALERDGVELEAQPLGAPCPPGEVEHAGREGDGIARGAAVNRVTDADVASSKATSRFAGRSQKPSRSSPRRASRSAARRSLRVAGSSPSAVTATTCQAPSKDRVAPALASDRRAARAARRLPNE